MKSEGPNAARGAAARVRVWPAGGHPFPERELVGSVRRAATGVCLSGGGTRSVAAAMGQLRGLAALGLLDEVGYLSAVSGGAWAAAPYLFAGSASDDGDRLGPVRRPETLSWETLSELDRRRLAFPATLDFKETLGRLVHDPSLPRRDIWSRAVGHTFLEPAGLFDPNAPAYFTLDEGTADDIRPRVIGSRGIRFQYASRGEPRPFLVISATLRWPDALDDGRQRIGFEMTPLYVGIPNRLTFAAAGGPRRTIGGYLEPFAFGCRAPAAGPDGHGWLRLDLPATPFTLVDVLGMTSAPSTDDRDGRYYPHADLWALDQPRPEPHEAVFTDGGDVENYGLMSLLRRRVERIAVFINSQAPLALDYDPGGWPAEFERELDPFLPPLFGQTTPRFQHNQVFARAQYAPLVRALQTARREGRTVMTTTTLDVEANGRWGVPGGWRTTICWMYNDRVPAWESRLAPDIRRAIENGHGDAPAGPFARFPNYRTRNQNPDALIRLTAEQINLLAELSCWNVVSNAGTFRALFAAG